MKEHGDKIKFIDEVNDRIWNQRGASQKDYSPMELSKEAHELAVNLGYRFGEARCLLNLGMGAFIIQHNSELSFQSINTAIDLFKEINEPKWVANALLTLGIIQNSMGNPEAALYNSLKGVDYFEHHHEATPDRVMAYYVVGTVYKDLKKTEEAERYYMIGLSAVKSDDDNWSGRIYASLCNIYTDLEKYEEALQYGLNALRILKAEKNDIGVSRALTDIGIIYKRLKNYESALSCFLEGLKIREEANIRQFIVSSLIEIALLHKEKNESEKAIAYFEKAERLALEINLLPKIARVYDELVGIYKSREDFKQALAYSEKKLQLTTELSKKEAEKKIANLKDSVLREKEEEIERLKNVELKQAYHLISEKQKEILDSINYAHRIQIALLTPEVYIERNLKRLNKKS